MDEPALPPAEAPDATTHASFQVAYKGSGVADGSMDVRELAPALHALGDLVSTSDEILNGGNSNVVLRVLAGFEKGSFDVNFLLDQSVRDAAAVILPAMGIYTAPQILDTVIGTYEKARDVMSGAARIYKALKGERPIGMRPGKQANTTILVLGNNNTVIADSASARLYNDERIRSSLSRAAGPLRRKGIDTLELKRSHEVIESLEPVDIEEAPMLSSGSAGSDESSNPPRDIWVRVVKPNFDGGRWTFHDGSAKFGAEVEDKEFQSRVDRREQGFFAGDRFLIRLRSIQHIDKNGVITTRNVVERVLDQRSAPRQHKLGSGTAEESGSS